MLSIPRTSGIYQILCIPTGKVYIGSAIDLHRRWVGHRAALRGGVHKNRHLQGAWNKYGADAFEFQVIELVLSPFLVEREQYWIDRTSAYDRQKGYNARPLADSNRGVVRSAEVRQRQSDRLRGKERGPYSDEHRLAIAEGKRGKKYHPHTEAARLKKSQYQLGRKHSDETKAKIGAAHKGKAPSAATRAAHFEALSKTYLVTDPNGNEQVIKGLGAFCREHGLTETSMSNVARGHQRHHKGWKCRRIEDT